MELLTRHVLVEKFGFQEIGTYVRIANKGNHYPSYHVKFEEMNFKNPAEEKHLSDYYDITELPKISFKIFSKSIHPSDDVLLFGIEDKKGNQFLFSEEGLIF